jgi:hypothetical protein
MYLNIIVIMFFILELIYFDLIFIYRHDEPERNILNQFKSSYNIHLVCPESINLINTKSSNLINLYIIIIEPR